MVVYVCVCVFVCVCTPVLKSVRSELGVAITFQVPLNMHVCTFAAFDRIPINPRIVIIIIVVLQHCYCCGSFCCFGDRLLQFDETSASKLAGKRKLSSLCNKVAALLESIVTWTKFTES